MNEMTNAEFQELLEEMKKDKNKKGQRKVWSPPSDKEGTFKIRFLPPIKKNGERLFYFNHRPHWINGKPYECLRQTLTDKNGNLHEAEDCPICKFVSKLYDTAEKDSDDYKLAGSLAAKDRYIYRILIRGNEDETKPEFYESGKKLFESIYHILTETDFGNIVDLKNGRDFNLVKVGTGRRSNYDTSSPSANPSMVFKTKEELTKLISNLESMPNFNSLIEFTTAEHLKEVLKNYLSGESETDDLVSAPTTREAKKEEKVNFNDPGEEADADTTDEEDDVTKLLKEFDTF